MKSCPCGSNLGYLVCCGQYLNHQAIPKTPEALMRSRYTAYTMVDFDYIKKTMQGKPLLNFNETEVEKRSKSILWLGLQVIQTHQEMEEIGFVEFIASYLSKNTIKAIHEVSEFHIANGCWFYVNGKQINEPTIKISRNTLCPCGSKRKFKNCHEQE